MSIRRILGGVGVVLTCPCHAIPFLLLLGGTAGSAWLARHLPLIVVTLGVLFLISLRLLLRPDVRPSLARARGGPAAGCATCRPASVPSTRDDA